MKALLIYFPTLIFLILISNAADAQKFSKLNFGFGNCHVGKFSPANDIIAFAVGNKVRLYRSGIEVADFTKHSSKITDFSYDSQGELIAASHANGYVTIWNAKQKKLIGDFKTLDKNLVACRFLESHEKLAVLSGKSLTIWSGGGELLRTAPATGGQLSALAVSKHGRLIAVGGKGKKIVMFDGLGNFIREFSSTQNWLLSLAISPNGKLLASGGKDGSVDIWDIDTGTLKETILKTNSRINTLEFSSDGKYLAAGSESFFILSVFKDQPDVVYRNLSGAVTSSTFSPNGKQIAVTEDFTPFAKIYDITDLNIPPVFQFKDEQDHIAPQIYISNPARISNDRVNFSNDLIDIQGSIFDDYGVRNLKINGIETPIRENGKFIIHLPLVMGENLIALEASDINGNSALKRFVINRKGSNDEDYDPLIARNFLFVISINTYEHWPQLNNAVKDGNDLAGILMKTYNFDLANVTILKDEQASLNNIYKGLRGLIEKITAKDNLIIYFSGHGHFDQLLNEGYWIPVEANAHAEGEYLSNSSVLRIIENIEAQHILLVADACFSGSLFLDPIRGKGGGYIETVEKIKSRWGLASGRLEVVSDGETGSNSPFARVLLSFLSENPKNEFTVSELVQHVKMKVAEEVSQTPIGNHLRLSEEPGGEFVFRKRKKTGEVTEK